MVAERVVGRIDALFREQLGDQPLARDDAVRAQEKERKEGALLWPADRDVDAVDTHRERAEDPEVEARRHPVKCPPVSPPIPGGDTCLGQAWDIPARRSQRRAVTRGGDMRELVIAPALTETAARRTLPTTASGAEKGAVG